MKKINFLLLILSVVMLGACSSPAEKAEMALRDLYMSEIGIELETCQLIHVADNVYEGFVTYTLSQNAVETIMAGKKGEDNEFLDAVLMIYEPFLDQLVDEQMEYQVRVLYDKRSIAVTDSEMTEDCERRLKKKMFGGLFQMILNGGK